MACPKSVSQVASIFGTRVRSYNVTSTGNDDFLNVPFPSLDCTPKVRHEIKGQFTLNGGEQWICPDSNIPAS